MALGQLHWTPATFWDATYFEFSSAAEGLRKFHDTGKKDEADGSSLFTRTEQEHLLESMSKIKEQFPDGPVSKDLRAKLKELRRRGTGQAGPKARGGRGKPPPHSPRGSRPIR